MTRRSETMRNSVLARHKLLEDVLGGQLKSPPRPLISACKSQGSFAELQMPEKGIVKMSLNTLKTLADQYIERGGWKSLDSMRAAFYQSGNAATGRVRHGAGSKSAIPAEPLELERRMRLRLEASYLDLLKKLANIAQDDAELKDFLQRHQAGFSLTRLQLVSGESDGG